MVLTLPAPSQRAKLGIHTEAVSLYGPLRDAVCQAKQDVTGVWSVHTGVDKADCARVAIVIHPVADDHLQTWEGDTWARSKNSAQEFYLRQYTALSSKLHKLQMVCC